MTAVTETLNKDIPDRLLSEIKTVGHLVDALETSVEAKEMPKGIPALELFAGQVIPPNMTLLNYRKKRWPEDVAQLFVRKAYEKAGVDLPQ